MCLSCFVRNRCKPERNCSLESIDDLTDSQACLEMNIVNTSSITESANTTLDISKIKFINDLWLVVPATEIIVKVSIFIPVVLWGVFGNVLLLHIIIKNKHLRSPTNLLIGNMATADLITLLVHPWVFLVYDFFQNYQLGRFGCKVEGGLECAVLLASVTNLVAISYDRLNSIVLPQERRLTQNGAKVVMVLAWFLGFALATPLFIFRVYKERQWLNFLEKFCTESVTVANIYWHVIITMLVWLPLTIMLICYITLFLKLNKYEQLMLRRMQSINVKHKKKVAKMIVIVVVTFMACRLPFTALIFYRNQLFKNNAMSSNHHVQNQVNGVYHTLQFVSKYLIILNAAINPIIYGLTSEKFRQAFKRTAIGRMLFEFKESELITDANVKKRRRQMTDNTKKIFFMFGGTGLHHNENAKCRNIQNNESAMTDCGSNVRIIK